MAGSAEPERGEVGSWRSGKTSFRAPDGGAHFEIAGGDVEQHLMFGGRGEHVIEGEGETLEAGHAAGFGEQDGGAHFGPAREGGAVFICGCGGRNEA